jgi:DNA-binding winged helix-turn-helix (wHTH) protein
MAPPRTFQVDLAREEDFTLGDLSVRPSRRLVEGWGQRRRLEPRVMQVLVALAHPTWDVVSRRELILRCWGGLTVSDDAVHRCIGVLRRLAAEWPEPPYEIRTVAKVGFYLKARRPTAPAPRFAGAAFIAAQPGRSMVFTSAPVV